MSLESIYHPEGRVFNTNTGTTGTDALRYEYSIRDHLGNTRLSFTDKNNNGKVDIGTTSANEVLSESHYYPFGLALNGPWMGDAAARDNPYRYNGKELNNDFGLGGYDYGARWYDAAVGRWSAVDPLAEKYSPWSGYNYVMGNPASLIDPDGNQPLPVEMKYNGNNLYVASWFGPRKVRNNPDASTYHKGLDFNFGSGFDDYGAPVYTTHDGTVSLDDDPDGKEGRMVTVTSPDKMFKTQYMHLSIANVNDGDIVSEGDNIGKIGASAKGLENGTASHLHYQIKKLNKKTGKYEQYNPVEGKSNKLSNIVDPQKWITNSNHQTKFSNIGNILQPISMISSMKEMAIDGTRTRFINRMINLPEGKYNVVNGLILKQE